VTLEELTDACVGITWFRHSKNLVVHHGDYRVWVVEESGRIDLPWC
jgi:hypothetical protein